MLYFEKSILKNYLIPALLMVFFSAGGTFGQEGMLKVSQLEAQGVVEKVVIPYITALQTGDVKKLEQLINGQLAVTLGTLLRENQEYPKFLREKFGKTRLLDTNDILEQKVSESFVKMANGNGAGSMTLEMSRLDGSLMSLQLSFDRNKSGKWNVVDQKLIN